MNLIEACFHLRERRRMYLMDDRYETTVAFIVGLAWAEDGSSLEGFDQWVADRLIERRSSSVWWSVIAEFQRDRGWNEMDANDLLLDLLESFLLIGKADGKAEK